MLGGLSNEQEQKVPCNHYPEVEVGCSDSWSLLFLEYLKNYSQYSRNCCKSCWQESCPCTWCRCEFCSPTRSPWCRHWGWSGCCCKVQLSDSKGSWACPRWLGSLWARRSLCHRPARFWGRRCFDCASYSTRWLSTQLSQTYVVNLLYTNTSCEYLKQGICH